MKNKILDTKEVSEMVNDIWFSDDTHQYPMIINPKETGLTANKPLVSPSVARPYLDTVTPINAVSFMDTPQYKVARKAVSWGIVGVICAGAVGGVAYVIVGIVEAIAPSCKAFSEGIEAIGEASLMGVLVLVLVVALIKILPNLFGNTSSVGGYSAPTPPMDANQSYNNPNINVQINVGGNQNNR